MKIDYRYWLAAGLAILVIGLQPIACARQAHLEQVLQQLRLPKGFKIAFFAYDLPAVRSLALAADGTVFAGTADENGKVYALQDKDGDGFAETHHVVASGLNMPNGVDYSDGALYVAEFNRILRFDRILQNLGKVPEPIVVYDKLPSERYHGAKYLRVGPDNKLYTAVGAPCNICDPENPIFTSLVRVNRDGSGFEILGRGIRNTVGFDWQPGTQRLYFTDNGRDYLGDDVPPEELNLWTKSGEHFGYPYCHGGTIADPEFGKGRKCADYRSPAWRFNAHVAPLGMRFYRGENFPPAYRDSLFVAQHGSWNRSQPDGYRVARIEFKDGKAVKETPFVEGWLQANGEVLGRPVDVLTLADGSLLISDDYSGVIYRVQYTAEK